MPSFPDSVFAPPNRSNGQTADASHMNGVQDELVAIEGGYLNATARLNSSGSTHTTLSVTGGTTLAGPLNSSNSTLANLSVTGGSTFAGAVTFSVPRVRVTHNANQDVANTAWTGLNWNTETYDPNGMHSTATNSSRLTFADSTGVYTVGASVEWNGGSTAGMRMIRLVLNDSPVIAATMIGESFSGGTGLPIAASGDVQITSTADYATVQVWQNSGSTASISSGAGGNPVASWSHKVSA